jgi:murein L,D-transpeptidase YcbB/YkuD
VVQLPRPVPVVIFYTTAIVRADGTIAFFEDLYGEDARLRRALARPIHSSPAGRAGAAGQGGSR